MWGARPPRKKFGVGLGPCGHNGSATPDRYMKISRMLTGERCKIKSYIFVHQKKTEVKSTLYSDPTVLF